MKSLVEHMNERFVDEAKNTVFNSIPECPINSDVTDEIQPSIDRCYEIASTLEDSHKNMGLLKKVRAFKGYDEKKLHDYAYCLEEIGGWINGIMGLAEDEIAEANLYVEMTKRLGVEYQACLENCAQNIDPAGFDSITSDEDIWNYFEDIFANWNDVSKAIFKMPWM